MSNLVKDMFSPTYSGAAYKAIKKECNPKEYGIALQRHSKKKYKKRVKGK